MSWLIFFFYPPNAEETCYIYLCVLTGVSCRQRMNGFRVFVTKSENTTDEAPVYTSTVNQPGPVIDIPLDWPAGR